MNVMLNPAQVTGDTVKMVRTNPAHMDASGKIGRLDAKGTSPFDQAMLKAIVGDAASGGQAASMVAPGGTAPGGAETQALQSMDEVSAYQQESSRLNQQMVVDPSSVDAHDVTIAMAKANLSLNLAKSVITRMTQAYRDLINSR